MNPDPELSEFIGEAIGRALGVISMEGPLTEMNRETCRYMGQRFIEQLYRQGVSFSIQRADPFLQAEPKKKKKPTKPDGFARFRELELEAP